METREKIVVAILVSGGLLLFSLAIFPLQNSSETPEKQSSHFKTDEHISLSSFQPSVVEHRSDTKPQSSPVFSGREHRYLVLYLIPASPCGNCINEVAEYIELVDTLNTNYQDIKQVAWFHGASESYVKQFTTILDLPISRVYSLRDSLTLDLLKFRETIIDRQLIIFDREEQKIIYRVLLPNKQLTPVHQKKSIITHAFPKADGFF